MVVYPVGYASATLAGRAAVLAGNV